MIVRRLIVGLGNPGPEYEDTRHNVGFRVLDRLARQAGLLFRSASELDGFTGNRRFSWARRVGSDVVPDVLPSDVLPSDVLPSDVLLVKPETWMNRSGEAVAPLLQWAGVPPGKCLVVYDDLDLPLGGLRIRPFGGAGGHNGMRSLLTELGSDRFPRLRVGIGRPSTEAARYVLEPFDPKEREDIEISIAEATEAILFWLTEGDIDECMTRFHSRWNPGQ